MEKSPQQPKAEQPQPLKPTKPPPAPLPKPKYSLEALDGEFLHDMDDESLSDVTRIFAGRCHQLCLHVLHVRAAVKTLTGARQTDLKQINETFQQIDGVLQQLTGTPDEAPSGEPAASEQPQGQEPAPPAEQQPEAAEQPVLGAVAAPLAVEPVVPQSVVQRPPPPQRPRPNGARRQG